MNKEQQTRLYYHQIDAIKKKCLNEKNVFSVSDALDKIFLHPILSFPIFILILLLIYFLSITVVGTLTSNFIQDLLNYIGRNLENELSEAHVKEWIRSLCIHGIFNSLSILFSFLFQLIALFFCFSILEESGYLSRVAFLFDRLLLKLKLSGKALVPLLLGLGCSVTGILACKTIESQSEKNKLLTLLPFIPCSAKLPMLLFFTSHFLKGPTFLIAASFYILSILFIIIMAKVISLFQKKETILFYVNELVPLKKIHWNSVLLNVYRNAMGYIQKIGTTIFISSLIFWVLLSFTWNLEYTLNVQETIMFTLASYLSPIFYPLLHVNSWELTISIFSGFISREQVLATFSMIQSMNQTKVLQIMSQSDIYIFILFLLFSSPCINTWIAAKKSLHSYKKVVLIYMTQTIVIYALCAVLSFIVN